MENGQLFILHFSFSIAMRPLIIGGGLAGLTAVLHLSQANLSPLLLEADPQYAGGRIAGGETITFDGFSFRLEHGVHGIWQPYVNMMALLDRFAIDPHLVEAQEETWVHRRNGRVRHAPVGRAIRRSWIPAPLHYLAVFLRPRFLGILGFRGLLSLPFVWYSLILAVGVDPLREQQPMKGLSLVDYTRRWSTAVRDFGIGLARNSLSADPADIPMSGFIAFFRYYTLMRRDNWNFSYLPGDGGTTFIDPLVEKAQAMGGEVVVNSPVSHIERDGDLWRVHTDNQSYETDQLILATDPDNAQAILQRSGLLDDTNYYWPRGRETAVIRIWFDRLPDPKSSSEAGVFTGDFMIDNFFWLHRLQDQYRVWHEATGGSVIEVHIYDAERPLEQTDPVLLTLALADIQAVFPELRGRMIHQHIQRNTVNHTLFGIGEKGKHLTINSPWDGLYCAGDWVYDPVPSFFLERAVYTGLQAANQILLAHNLEPIAPETYPEPEPFAAFLERIMHKGRNLLRKDSA